MARPPHLDRVADRGDGPASEVVRRLVVALDADGQQQLNRFAHCSKLTVRCLERETAYPAGRMFPRGAGRLILRQ